MIYTNKNKPTSCPECVLGWLEEITLRQVKWYRCMSCGWMKRVSKKIIREGHMEDTFNNINQGVPDEKTTHSSVGDFNDLG